MSIFLEFRHYSILADAIHVQMIKDSQFQLRVPLSSLIEYKGIVVLALDITEQNDSVTLIQGITKDGNYTKKNNVSDQLICLAKHLNIKTHELIFDDEVSTKIETSVQL